MREADEGRPCSGRTQPPAIHAAAAQRSLLAVQLTVRWTARPPLPFHSARHGPALALWQALLHALVSIGGAPLVGQHIVGAGVGIGWVGLVGVLQYEATLEDIVRAILIGAVIEAAEAGFCPPPHVPPSLRVTWLHWLVSTSVMLPGSGVLPPPSGRGKG